MRWHHQTVRRLIVTMAAAIVALGAVASPAQAQFGDLAGFSEAMTPEYLSRDLTIISSALELDKAQAEVLESLYRDYETAFDDGLKAMRSRLEQMKSELGVGDQKRIMNLIFAPFEDWAADRRVLGEQLMQNVELILNDQQKPLMPSLQRRLVREKTLSRGKLSGESLDLVLIVKQLDLTEPQIKALRPYLDDYEIALDESLRNRNRILIESQTKTIEALQEQDSEKNLELIDRQIAARIKVRRVNETFLASITAALPADRVEEFQANALGRAYANVYQPTAAERMFKAAVKMELDESTLESVRALHELYTTELDYFRQGLIDVIRDYEPRKERNRVEMFASRMKGDQVVRLNDPSLAEVRKRDAIDDQYISMLQNLLTADEFARLPGAQRWLNRRANKERISKVPSRDRARQQAEQSRKRIRELQEEAKRRNNETGGKGGTGGDKDR